MKSEGTMTIKYYAGIGSRETPPEVLLRMTQIARILSSDGWVLRSGGAKGADSAFDQGAFHSQVFLPWKNFNKNDSLLDEVSDEAIELALTVAPHIKYMGWFVKRLHGRNCYQVLGPDLKTPSQMVICWTPRGRVGGGT